MTDRTKEELAKALENVLRKISGASEAYLGYTTAKKVFFSPGDIENYERALAAYSREQGEEKRSVNLRQDMIQDSVNIFLQWKANEKLHGGNVHRLMGDVYDRIADALATPSPQPTTDKSE